MAAILLGTSFGGIFYAEKFAGAILNPPTDQKTGEVLRGYGKNSGFLFWQKYGDQRQSVEEFLDHLRGYVGWVAHARGDGGGLELTSKDRERFNEIVTDFDEGFRPEFPSEPSIGDIVTCIYDLKDLRNIYPGEVLTLSKTVFEQIYDKLHKNLARILEGEFLQVDGFDLESTTPFLGKAEIMELLRDLINY